jgi:hypothetical protein
MNQKSFLECPIDLDIQLKNLEITFQTVNRPILLRILDQIRQILNGCPLAVSYLLRFHTLHIWLSFLSDATSHSHLTQLILQCFEYLTSNSSDIAQILIDRNIFELFNLILTHDHTPLILQTIPRVCISIIQYSSEFCELYLKSPLFEKFYDILNMAHNSHIEISAYANGESSVI